MSNNQINLISLIENFTNKQLPNLHFNINGRYKQSIEEEFHSVSSSLGKNSKLFLEERYSSIANQFNISPSVIEKQYELALKTRIEIPPLLMRRIIIDAIGILHLIKQEFNQEHEKFPRIIRRINQLEMYNQLFDHHC